MDGAFLAPAERGEIVVKGGRAFGPEDGDSEYDEADFIDGWFRTGDEGFLDEDGYLTVTGRIKEMINRGGEKVSPTEVDAALVSHPGVREAATFPIAHPTLGEEVAAAVVRTAASTLTEKDLSRFVLTKLAGFKVPRRIVFVDQIPKSDAGKVQRYKLAQELGVGIEKGTRRPGRSERELTPSEYRLHSIWRRVLGNRNIGVDDNFFLVGGDSLQAVELFLQIEKELKQRLPVAVLFEAGTVAEMAALIEEGVPQGCVVPIQPEGAKPPFFCVHGATGQVIGFHHLSRHLGKDQPFYGIQSIGWDATTPPYTKTADMAAHYVAGMREVQPHGPYYLGGYSFGGRIAVHMANMLKAAGEEVAFLALLDPSSLIGRQYVNFGQWLERIEAPPGPSRLLLASRYGWFRARRAADDVYVRARRAILFPIREYYRRSGRKVPMSMRRPDRLNRLIRIEHRHMPSYDGDAIHFKTAISRRSMNHRDVKDSWNRVIKGRLEVVPVPGRHSEIIREPHVRDLAKALGPALDSAHAKAKDPKTR